MPSATSGEASILIAAPPEVVYDVITDVTTVGERSPECYRAEWLDGATHAVAGARFKGYNRLGVIRWSTVCVVTKADAPREFAFTVVNGHGREETRWSYLVTPEGDGVRVTETYQFLWCPVLARIAELPFPRDRQLRRGLRSTLEALRSRAESLSPRPR